MKTQNYFFLFILFLPLFCYSNDSGIIKFDSNSKKSINDEAYGCKSFNQELNDSDKKTYPLETIEFSKLVVQQKDSIQPVAKPIEILKKRLIPFFPKIQNLSKDELILYSNLNENHKKSDNNIVDSQILKKFQQIISLYNQPQVLKSANEFLDAALMIQKTNNLPISKGQNITFEITTCNQGTAPITALGIISYIPEGFSLDDVDWILTGTNATRILIPGEGVIPISGIPPDSCIIIPITLLVNNNANRNNIEIFAEIGVSFDVNGLVDDVDSTPDTNPNNDAGGQIGSPADDYLYGDGTGVPGDGVAATDEDDHDGATVKLIDLALKKEISNVSPPPYSYGNNITFEITIENQGNEDVQNIEISDYMPSGFSFSPNNGWIQTSPNLLTNVIPGPLAGGSSLTVELILKLEQSSDVDAWVNYAEISEFEDLLGNPIGQFDFDSTPDRDPNNDAGGLPNTPADSYLNGDGTGNIADGVAALDEDDHDPAFVEIFDLALRKTLNTAGPYSYGQTLTFKIEVFNQGNVPASNIVVNDYVPNGYTFSSNNGWTGSLPTLQNTILGPLAPGTSDTLLLELVLQNSPSGQYINYAEIASANGPNGPGFDADSTPGSNTTAENEVGLGDTEDDDIDIAPGDGAQDDHDPAGPFIFDLALIKEVVTATPSYSYGQNVIYRMVLINQGSVSATGIEVTDYLPCGLEFDMTSPMNNGWTLVGNNIVQTLSDTILPGRTDTLNVSMIVRPCYIDPDNAWTNFAEISGAIDVRTGLAGEDIDSTPDSNPTNDTGGVPDFNGDISGTDNTIANENGDEDDHDVHKIQVFDLALRKILVTNGPYSWGQMLTFEIEVFNQGNVIAENIVISNYIPAGFTFVPNNGWTGGGGLATHTIAGPLAPGTSTTIPLQLTLIQNIIGGNAWHNYAEVSASMDDKGNNRNDDADSVADSNPNNDNPVQPGDLDDDNIFGLGPNANQDEDDHDVAAPIIVDLALRKTIVTPGPYKYGDPVTFRVTIYNQGNVDVQNVAINDYLSSGFTFVANNGWTQSSPSLLVNTIGGPLAAGTSTYIDLILTPIASSAINAWLNSAEIYGLEDLNGNQIGGDDIDSTPDNDPTNDAGGNPNTDSDDAINGDGTGSPGDTSALTDEDDHDVALLDVIDIALRKTVVTSGPYQYNQDITYNIEVFNQGNVPLYNIEVTDYLPPGLEFVQALNPLWTLNGSQAITTIAGPLNEQSSTILTIVLRTRAIIPGSTATNDSWTNAAEVSYMEDENGEDITGHDSDSTGDNDPNNDPIIDNEINGNPNDPNSVNDEDDHDIAFIEIFDLALRKTLVTGQPYSYNTTHTFMIEVFNQGNVPATNIVVNDYLPIGYSFISNNGWTGVAPNIQNTIIGPILPGNSASLMLELTLEQTNGGLKDWVNYAEIASANGPNGNGFDADSTPGSNNSDENNTLPGGPGDDDVDSSGDGSIGSQDDHDPAGPSIFDLALRMEVVTATPSYSYGQTVRYKITIYNQGNVPANNIIITNYLPCGLTFNEVLPSNADWSQVGNNLMTTYSDTIIPGQSEEIFLDLVVSSCYVDENNAWTNFAEITSAIDLTSGLVGVDIDSTPDDINGNDAGGEPNFEEFISGTDDTIDNENGDEDDHDGHKIQVFDLALRKVVDSRGPFTTGEIATFRIHVFNQGNVAATNIVINDYIRNGFIFNALQNPGWTLVNLPNGFADGLLTFNINSNLLPGENIEIILNLEVSLDDNPSAYELWNYAEIGSAMDLLDNNRNDDADSTPNSNSPYENAVIPDGPWDNLIDGNGPNFNEDEDDHDVDKIIIAISGLGDFVWNDFNANGIQDLGESGVGGVVVKLMDCAGNLLQTTVSDNSGFYLFNNLITGNFRVHFDISGLPSGSSFTLQNQGSDLALDSDADNGGWTSCFFLNAGENNTTIDAGILSLGTIGNFVWHDLNGDGLQGSGEPGIIGVQVNLYSGTGTFIGTTVTNNLGRYLFDFLYPGDYYLEFISPDGFESTLENIGENDAVDSDVDGTNGPNTTRTFTLASGQVDLSWDAGFYQCIPIGDLVWYDFNKNDIADNFENGINGILVNLWRNIQGTWTIWDSQYTDHKPGTPSDDGYYKFCAPPGQYYIQVVMPPVGLVRARPNIGGNPLRDSDLTNANGPATTNTFTVLSGQEKCDIGAGFYPQAIAGNLVWLDENLNGIQDSDELRIEGALVQAMDANSHELLVETQTEADGSYELGYIEKRDIYLKFTLPSDFAQYSPTMPGVGDDSIDSDVDNTFGANTTRMFSMEPGLVNEDIDFGVAFGILPVEWLDISAKKVAGTHLIEWSTAREVNVSHYVVERRLMTEGTFEALPGETKANGNVNRISKYSYTDTDVTTTGDYYYRVRQVDYDGKTDLSKEVRLSQASTYDVSIYPNPAKTQTTLTLELGTESEVSIEMYDTSAKLVKEIMKQVELNKGKHTQEIDLINVSAGVYTVMIKIEGEEVIQKKLIVVE